MPTTSSSLSHDKTWGFVVSLASVAMTALAILGAGLVRFIPGVSHPVGTAAGWIVGYGIFFAVLALVSHKFGTGSWPVDFGLKFRPVDVLLAAAGVIVVTLISSAASKLGLDVTGKAPPTNAHFGGTGPGPLLINGFLGAGVVAPLCEEIMFRGLILRGILRSLQGRHASSDRIAWARTGAVVASAVLFAALHMYEAAGSESEFITLGLSTVALGLVNGFLAVRTGRLGAPILIHIALNMLSTYAIAHPF